MINKISLSISAVLALALCTRCSNGQSVITSAAFNKMASTEIISNLDIYNLDPLSDVEKCIFKNVVTNDLNELNGSRIVIINDRFMIKNYYEGYSQFRFSFIQDMKSDKTYFIGVPSLDKYICDVSLHYKEKNDREYLLNETYKIKKLDTSLLDSLFLNEAFKVDGTGAEGIYNKIKEASNVLREILTATYVHEFSGFVGVLENQINDGLITKVDYDKILGLYQLNLKENYKVDVCNMDFAGCVIIVYSFDKAISQNIKVEVYFMPKQKRTKLHNSFMPDYWQECSGNFPDKEMKKK
jgi:hypothetical protein